MPHSSEAGRLGCTGTGREELEEGVTGDEAGGAGGGGGAVCSTLSGRSGVPNCSRNQLLNMECADDRSDSATRSGLMEPLSTPAGK